jgi:hypothetical protein
VGDKFDIVFPPKGRQLLDGGLNSKFERSLINDNETPSCQNVVFSDAAVGTRPGATKLNTAAIGSFVGDGLYTRRGIDGTSESMIVFAGGTAWALSGTSFSTIGSAQSVFTAGVRVGTTQYENHMFIGNGGVTPYKYNGLAFTRHGVPAPSISGCTGAVSATGGTFPSATFYYKVTNVNSAAAEGNPSSASTAFAVAANGSVALSGIPVAPQSHGVASRRIYRASGAGGTFERITTIADNTTTAFVDTYYPVGAAAPSDNGEPPNYSVAVTHQNRLFVNDAANPNYVWYSNLFEPYTFGATNFIPVGDASFDLVKGLDVYDNAVVVRCERGTYMIVMPSTDPTDWAVIKTRSPYGSKSPFGAFLYNNNLMVPSIQSDKFVGFAALAGSTIDPEASHMDTTHAGSDLRSARIEDEVFAVQEAYVGNISAYVFRNKAYIAVTYGDNQTQNNRILVYDFSIVNLAKGHEASWSILAGLSAAQFTVYGGHLYFVDSTATGFVRRVDTDVYVDDGTAIDSYFWTKEFAGLKGHENLQKDFRKVRMLVDRAGSYFMNFTYRVDSDSGDGTTVTVNLTPTGSTWNSFTWGSGNWGGGRVQDEITVTLGQVSGKRIQFKFSNQNTVNQRFKIHGINFTYNVKGQR